MSLGSYLKKKTAAKTEHTLERTVADSAINTIPTMMNMSTHYYSTLTPNSK